MGSVHPDVLRRVPFRCLRTDLVSIDTLPSGQRKEVWLGGVGVGARLRVALLQPTWFGAFNEPTLMMVFEALVKRTGVMCADTLYPNAFVGLLESGRVVAWGDAEHGGVIPPNALDRLQSGVTDVVPTDCAFAALKEDGSVVTWGCPDCGGDSSGTANQLESRVSRVIATESAFAALKEDGRVVTWGGWTGGFTRRANELAKGVQTVVATRGAFAALTEGGRVVTWGNALHGYITADINDVVDIASSDSGFAALKRDGTTVTWGWGAEIARETLLQRHGMAPWQRAMRQ